MTDQVADVVVIDEGTIVAFHPLTPLGIETLEETIGHAQRFGVLYCVEHRYAGAIIEGLQNDYGLLLKPARVR